MHLRSIDPTVGVTGTSGELDEVIYQGNHILTLTKPSSIRGIHSGRCLLVASGPSAKKLDLSLYDEVPAFFMNGSILCLTHER